jgi:hypothetical protein
VNPSGYHGYLPGLARLEDRSAGRPSAIISAGRGGMRPLWDPVSGYDGAEAINYQATKAHVGALRVAEMNRLDNQLASEEIDLKRYTLEKRKVEDKYSAL